MELNPREDVRQILHALRPDRYNVGLTLLVFLGSSHAYIRHLVFGPGAVMGTATAGFPYIYWGTWHAGGQGETALQPLLALGDIALLYITIALLFGLGRRYTHLDTGRD